MRQYNYRYGHFMIFININNYHRKIFYKNYSVNLRFIDMISFMCISK